MTGRIAYIVRSPNMGRGAGKSYFAAKLMRQHPGALLVEEHPFGLGEFDHEFGRGRFRFYQSLGMDWYRGVDIAIIVGKAVENSNVEVALATHFLTKATYTVSPGQPEPEPVITGAPL